MSPDVEEDQTHESTSVKPPPESESQARIKEERKEEDVTPKSDAATFGAKDEPAEPDSEDSLRPDQRENLRRLIDAFPPLKKFPTKHARPVAAWKKEPSVLLAFVPVLPFYFSVARPIVVMLGCPFLEAFRLSCGLEPKFTIVFLNPENRLFHTPKNTTILKGKCPILTRKMQEYWKITKWQRVPFHACTMKHQKKNYCVSYRVWPFDPTASAITQTIASRNVGMQN